MIKNNQYVVDRLYDGVTASTTRDTTTGDATVIDYYTSGLSQADALKLASIQTGAEVNQLAFSYIKVDSIVNPIAAILKTDTLNVIGTSPILITIDESKNLIFSFDTSIIPDITEINDHITDTNIHHTHSNRNALDLLSVVDGKLRITGDMYATGEVSAYGMGIGGGGIAVELSQLVDVIDTWTPLNADILYYDGTLGKWKNIASSTLQTNLTGYATEVYVNAQIANLVDQAPSTLDTLNELAAALGDDPNFATTTANLIGTKWTQDNTKITNWDSAYTNSHSHVNMNALNLLSVVDGKLRINGDMYATGEVSAYGVGTGDSGGSSGSVIELKQLVDVVDTLTPVDKDVLYFDSSLGMWTTIASSSLQTDLGSIQTDLNAITSKVPNWDLAYTNAHTHANKTILDSITSSSAPAIGHLFLSGTGTVEDPYYLYTDVEFYSEKGISAYGIGSGGSSSGGTTELNDLVDIAINLPVTNNLLQYNGSFWINVPASTIQTDLTGYATESYVNTQVTNKTNWDTAYSWGNHATAGYLTALTENDPLFTASPAASINSNDILLLNHLEYDATNSTSILKGDLSNFSVPLGPELLTVNNWTSTGWTGNFTDNFTHAVGNTNPLSNSIVAISGNRYIINISTLDGGGGSITVSFGGTSRVVLGDDSVSIGIFATNTNNFIITPTTDFIGTIYNISIKLVTGIIPALTTCKTNANVIINETRYSLSGNLYIGSNSGQYSIGTGNTSVGSKALYSIIDGDYNTAIGTNSLFYTVNGNTNVGIGTFAGINNISGTNNIFFGYSSGTKIDSGQPLKNPTDSIFIGNSTRALVDNGVNEIVIGTSVVGLGSNTVSIGTSNTTLTRVYGNLYATGEVTAYQTSDIRLKENITNVNNSLKILDTLRPVTYNWNDVAKQINPTKTDNEDVGLIAQELEEVLPNLVHTMDNGYKSIDYIKLIPYLIGAIKELKKEINLLNNID